MDDSLAAKVTRVLQVVALSLQRLVRDFTRNSYTYQTSLRQCHQENEPHVGQPCYLGSLVDDEHWAPGSLCRPVSTVNGKPLHYKPPHLAVDSADHNYSKLQHEGQLSLCCLGSPVVDGFVVGSLCERTSGKVSGRTSVLRVLSPR